MMKKYDWGKMTWREIDAVIQLEIFETPVYRTDKDFFYVVDIEDTSIGSTPKIKSVPHYSRNICDTVKILDELTKKYFISLHSSIFNNRDGYEVSIADDYADEIIARGEDGSVVGAILKCVIDFINKNIP